MQSSINNYFFSLKKFVIKNELNFLYFFLLLAIFNNVSHFVRKNLLGDRVDFWDFHVYWCSAKKFINGINPYGGETIKNCLSQFNFDLYFSYPPIVLKFLSFLGYFNLNTAKIIWIAIVLISFLVIIFYLKKIYQIPKIFFFTLLLIFTGGGLIWSALLAGNISIILYAILSIGIYYLIKKKKEIYYLSIFFISLVKFPFLIFFFMPIFLYGYKEIKKSFFYLFLTLFIYYLQFYFDKELFMSFLNSTKTYKSEGFLLIHGTGIGIHGIIDLYQNILYEKTSLKLLNPSGLISFFIHIFISGIFFLSSFFLFQKKNIKGPAFVIALSERINCALANDSGTAHMIDAGGAPIIKVFGKSLPGKYTGLTKGSITIDSRIFGSTDINEISPTYVIKKIEEIF